MVRRQCRSTQLFFFFQAEDGIRDLVRSRGLGDVYKRQLYESAMIDGATGPAKFRHITLPLLSPTLFFLLVAVSYTHLTLPTSDLV
mgnify:CR=1 FL=1